MASIYMSAQEKQRRLKKQASANKGKKFGVEPVQKIKSTPKVKRVKRFKK